MNTKRLKSLAAVGFVVLGTLAGEGSYAVGFTINTSGLMAHPASPFAIDVQLVDGDGIVNNIVSLSNLSLEDGRSLGTPTTVGGASGDIDSEIRLSDTAFFSSFTQPFVAGARLSFDLNGSASGMGPVADEVSISFLDRTGAAVPTTALSQLGSDVLIRVVLEGGAWSVQTFNGDLTRVPLGGGLPIDLTVLFSPVPEPSRLALGTFVWVPFLAAWRRLRRGRLLRSATR
jgi:hypothetical protein